MSYEFYKILHILGFITLFASLGFSSGVYFSQKKNNNHKIKNFMCAPLHGISLLIILISGFGLIAKIQLNASVLFYSIKLGVWFTLGTLLFILRKYPSKSNIFLLVAIILGVLAGTTGFLKL